MIRHIKDDKDVCDKCVNHDKCFPIIKQVYKLTLLPLSSLNLIGITSVRMVIDKCKSFKEVK